jgi:hypothetical protein
MDFYETTLENGGDRNSEGFKESYKDLLCLRESICNEVHVLNSKGSKNV